MEYIPVAIIAVVILTGIVALAMGFRGWHPANTAGAWLVLLASCGFLALAGVRGQSERAWATMLRGWESKVLEVRDAVRADVRGKAGLQPLGECSLDTLQNCPVASLEAKEVEWSRALDRVNSWRGRFWKEVTFVPPTVKDAETTPGRITIAEPEKPSIAEGAELYLFDSKPLGDGGKFIGGFRVTQVNDNQLAVLPLGPVEDRDREVWNAPHEDVVAYENLPFDRWMAFHRTGRDAEATVIPEPTKQVPENGRLREDVERHDFPEELISSAGESDSSPFPEDPDVPPPGVDWATLEFEEDFDWTPEGSDGRPATGLVRFKAGEKVSAFPARDVAPLRKAGATFKHAWSIPPGMFWAEVEFSDGYTHERDGADAIEFAAGDVVRLPLEDAEKLAKDGKLAIKRRFYRRPLNAAGTALRGGAAVDRAGRPTTEGGIAIDAIGIFRMTELLRKRIAVIDQNRQEVVEAQEASKRQLVELEGVKGRLEKDLGNWSGDVATAEKLEKEAARRFEAARASLETSERAIVELGTRLRKLTSTLATEVDRRTPPPASSPPAGG
jgi:hypothetical protein